MPFFFDGTLLFRGNLPRVLAMIIYTYVISPILIRSYFCVGNGPALFLKISKGIFVVIKF